MTLAALGLLTLLASIRVHRAALAAEEREWRELRGGR